MKILTVQSDEVMSKFFKEFMEKAGFEVDIASDGLDCLNKMIKQKYDAVLLNSMIPVMDGYEVVETFKRTGKEQGKIIITTNLISKIAIEEGFKIGIDGYEILTQIKPDELIDKVKKYIEGKISKETSKQNALNLSRQISKD